MPWSTDSLLIRGGRVIDPANDVDDLLDLLIDKGTVATLGRNLGAPAGTPVYEAAGLIVAPGFIDAHVHLREPGFEAKETIATGTAAAASGGICAVVAMPNTVPPPDCAAHLRMVTTRAAATGTVRVYPLGCITRGREGRRLAPLDKLARAGAVGFSDDGDPVTDPDLMQAALAQARTLGLPLSPHEELKPGRNAGPEAAPAFHGASPEAEEGMIARDLELVRLTGGHLHVAHVSTAQGVALIRRAREAGLPVTCEATPHHLTLTQEALTRHGSNAKMNPPLRTSRDVEALCQGLRDGSIDVIATDHAPHTEAEKALPLDQAPCGIVGLETAVGLTLTHLVHAGALDLKTAVDRWSRQPARIFGLPGGRLNPGSPGDVTVLDLEREWTVDPERFRSKGRNTPFGGWPLRGKAVATIVGGCIVFQDSTNG